MTTSPSTGSSPPAYADDGQVQGPAQRRRWERSEIAVRLVSLDEARGDGRSERDFEASSKTPRSTFRHWDARRQQSGEDSALAAFMESPSGVECLHRIVIAAAFVLTLRAPEGLRHVSEFLELSGLAQFAASSFGSMQKLLVRMEELVVQFGADQRAELAKRMTPKPISVCEDETFHPEICLVAIEPVSNFILVEEYAEKRDAETWTERVKTALVGLPVTVVQTTSDEAKALGAHARDAFQAHHSPDVFHPQHTASRATSLALASRVERAEEALEKAKEATEQTKCDQAAYEGSKHGPGRPPDFESRRVRTEEAERGAREALERAKVNQAEVRESIRRISRVYHPYALADGARQSAQEVERQLGEAFADIRRVADAAGLSHKSLAGIAKAERVVESMVDTIRFTHEEIERRLAGLDVAEDIRREIAGTLVPAWYLRRAAARMPTAEKRLWTQETADRLLERLERPGGPLAGMAEHQRHRLDLEALACADVFQRSSSCVEGRNGQLSLFHHGLHRLTPRKLAALTVLHNFHVMRADGSTAAERFFGEPAADLFDYLVQHLPLPRRPAKKRAARRPRGPRPARLGPREARIRR